MSRNTIEQFMWGYQAHFRIAFERLLDAVLRELGATDVGGKCLLVGTQMPDENVARDVCIEPENDRWPDSLFTDLLTAIEAHVKNHPLKNMHYGDEPSMRDKPENIRRDSVRKAVQNSLSRYDRESNVHSFAGAPAPVDGYYVVPVLQLPSALFERFRPLRDRVTEGRFVGDSSLVHAAIRLVLDEAHDELQRSDPGRFLRGRHASATEIAKRAASSFMDTIVAAIGDRAYQAWGLFEHLNVISTLMYEGEEGRGKMILANLDSGAVDVALKLAESVSFNEPRWARKILQMASSETALLADSNSILGLGSIAKGTDPWSAQNVYTVEFHDHFHWSLSCGNEVLLVSRFGAPSLPGDRFPRAKLFDTFQRLFPESKAEDLADFTELFDAAAGQRRGSMLVVAADAAAEAARLRGQGTQTVPTKLTPELYRRVSNIDGTIIVDPKCVCHAVGVILDGPANEQCTPSRGARYNSGIRYVAASSASRLAIVVSDDGTVDAIPMLRPRIRKSVIEEQIAKLEASSIDTYHEPIGWLDKHRFYLDQAQCDRINAEQKRLEEVPLNVGEMRILHKKFTCNSACTAEYYEQEVFP